MRLPAGDLVFDADTWGPADGEPVLLLHGFPEGRRCWSRVGPLLAAGGVHAVAPDQRGYSPDARPANVAAYALEHLVGDAERFLDALAWPSAHVVGQDWGAVVAWALAAVRQERVRSLTAVSVPHPAAFAYALGHVAGQRVRSAYIGLFRREGTAERVLSAAGGAALRGMLEGSGLEAEETAAVVDRLLAPGALTAALAWYRAVGTDALAAVPAVAVPTTYVWGSDDVAVSREAAERSATEVLGEYRFVALDGVGHWVPEDVPGELAAEILARVGTAGQPAAVTDR